VGEAGGQGVAARRSGTVEIGRDHLSRFLARDDRHDLETHARAAALEDPLLEQAQIVAFHELEAAIEIRLDPAADIFEAFGKDDARVAVAPIDGHGVAVF